MNEPTRIAVLVISYRNNPELIAFLQHLANFPSRQISFTVATANGLNPTETEALSTATSALMPERLRLVAGPQNPGYFGGALLGWRELQSYGPTPEWIIVTNDDIRFAPDFFELLSSTSTADIAVLAPDIVVPATGLHQNPLYVTKPPASRLRLLQWLHQHSVVMRLFVMFREFRQFFRRHRTADTAPIDQAIYAPHGSCVVFSRQYFTAGGSLDYPCFLYGEELFVAETVRRIGLSIRVAPALHVLHHEHSTTDLLAPVSLARHVHDSLGFILREYYKK